MNFVYREAVCDSCPVNLSGPLNVSRSEDVVQLFQDLSDRGVERVVIGLEDVPFIDSQGLAALIAGYEIFGSDARNFRLTGIQDQPRLVLELTGFERVFQIVPHAGVGVGEVMTGEPQPEALPDPMSPAFWRRFSIPDSIAYHLSV